MSEKVIKLLNDGRKRELVAIMQYMIHHYELEDKGFDKLGDKMKEIAIVEMKHAEELAERILFLGGVPVSKPEADIQKGLAIIDKIKVDEKLEAGAIELYNDAVNVCAAEKDHVSKAIFEKLAIDENDHLDEFQTIREHIEQFGDTYLTAQTE